MDDIDAGHRATHRVGSLHSKEILMLASSSVSPVDLQSMSEAERLRYEHEQLHAKHANHESMHAAMLGILVLTMLVAQVGLVEWRKRRFRSYQIATLIGMWLIPTGFCVHHGWWRFTVVWLVFSAVTLYLVKRANGKPIDGRTPRLVYTWFILIYKASYGIGLLGYMALMLTLLGVNLMFDVKPHVWMDFGLVCLFYGLYYGVLGRDFAEICSDTMASTIGYYSATGIPMRGLEPGVCAVCGNATSDAPTAEKTYQLACGHTFHEFCVRGWCIVGKKQTCPYCKEKVDLKRMFCNPWERPHMLYGQLLDWIRYLVAWQPLILTSVQLINWLLGLE